MAILVIVAAFASAVASTALERLSSVGEVGNENSLKWRVVESHLVVQQISAQPLRGYGFGATITWGVKDTFATMTTPYIHNAYLWLAWKVGLPFAAIFVLFLIRAVLRRSAAGSGGEWRTLQRCSQMSLLALLVISITFPVFNSLGITAAMGLLVAVCYSRPQPEVVPDTPRSDRQQPYASSGYPPLASVPEMDAHARNAARESRRSNVNLREGEDH